MQGKTAIVPLPSATREKGRRPVLSRRKNGSGYACIFNIFPAYKIFLCLFKNISPNIPRYMRFISLFVVLLREQIYIRGYLLFQNIFEKYFSKLRAKFRFRSILGEIFGKEKKMIREISKESKRLDSLFFEKKVAF